MVVQNVDRDDRLAGGDGRSQRRVVGEPQILAKPDDDRRRHRHRLAREAPASFAARRRFIARSCLGHPPALAYQDARRAATGRRAVVTIALSPRRSAVPPVPRRIQ